MADLLGVSSTPLNLLVRLNMSKYLRESISNGNPKEQALIRRWWYETKGAQGRMVWEYYLEGKYADGILFFGDQATAIEEPGDRAPERFPLDGTDIILCEAKGDLNPELIGQALVYSHFAIRAGAKLRDTIIFAENGSDSMKQVAAELGLTVMVGLLEDDQHRSD